MAQESDHRIKVDNLPLSSTLFIGREREIAEIVELLADPACRLLTLVGPGGIGKTRLAIQTASKMQNFSQGIYFVPLQPIQSMNHLISAVADALNFPLSGQEEAHIQVLNYLRDKEILLILDNFEQLLGRPTLSTDTNQPDSTDLVTDILETAPGVKLLITSREVLNLQGEWLYPIRGLPYPKDDQSSDIADYGAVQLFVERARQVWPDFCLTTEEAAVARICRFVEGLPLAIELAASWTKTLRCEDIAAKTRQSLRFLATRLRDVPKRHRTIQAVFDQSWQLLTEAEQEIFRQLSIFRGSFEQKAATAITGASLPVLSALIDKSLLRRKPEGRYHMHELLRQYAEERLQEIPEAAARVRDCHCAYYADFLHKRLDDVLGGRQKEAVAEIEPELGNIRLAWQRAVAAREVKQIRKATQTLSLFYQFQGRYVEGTQAFEAAVQSLKSTPPTEQIDLTLILVLVDLAWFYIRLGWLAKAEAVLAWCRKIYDRLDRPPVPGHGTDPLLALGIIASIRGDYNEAARLGEKVRQVAETYHHLWNHQFAYYLLTRTALDQGEYDAARQYARQAYLLTEKTQDDWFMAYCHNELGNIARALGDYEAAKNHFEASYTIRQSFNDPEGQALALSYLGEITLEQRSFAAAEQLYRRSLKIYKDINDQGGVATSLTGLGHTACASGETQAAQQYFHQALQIARDINFVPLICSILIGAGKLLLQTRAKEQGIELLALTLHHPASDSKTKAMAQQALARYEAKLPANIFAAVVQRGQSRDLEMVAASLQAKLVASQNPAAAIDPATVPPPADHPSQLDQSLIEPLTPRELEVLHLIAEGHTNQEIADKLFIAIGTVKAHASNLYGKLDVNNRTEAVAKAKELGLL